MQRPPHGEPAALLQVRIAARQRRERDELRCRLALSAGRSGSPVNAGSGSAGADVRSSTAALAAGLMQHRVTINFHPDRRASDGQTAAESLRDNGIYHNQYRTGVSAGSLTAFAGGVRESWERRLFGAESATLPPELRPRYGGLDVAAHADGACPRFGSCYLVLDPSVLSRCTFLVGDSHRATDSAAADLGTVDQPVGVLAGLLERALTGDALNLPGGIDVVIDQIIRPPANDDRQREQPVGRALDEYIETQVHGPVTLDSDVAQLVIDPSFDNTQTGKALADAAERHGLQLTRHPGFALGTDDLALVPDDFRGPEVIELAYRTAREYGAPITAASIGALAREPAADREPLRQQVKQLWHMLVAFGRSPA